MQDNAFPPKSLETNSSTFKGAKNSFSFSLREGTIHGSLGGGVLQAETKK